MGGRGAGPAPKKAVTRLRDLIPKCESEWVGGCCFFPGFHLYVTCIFYPSMMGFIRFVSFHRCQLERGQRALGGGRLAGGRGMIRRVFLSGRPIFACAARFCCWYFIFVHAVFRCSLVFFFFSAVGRFTDSINKCGSRTAYFYNRDFYVPHKSACCLFSSFFSLLFPSHVCGPARHIRLG